MHPRLAAAADRQSGVFTTADAAGCGYEPDEIRTALRNRYWVRLRRGVYAARETVDATDGDPVARHLLDCVAVLLCLRPGAVLSHGSAARLHGLVVPRALSTDVVLSDDQQWRRGRGYEVMRAAVRPADRVSMGRFWQTSVPRTLVDCARGWRIGDAVVAMDDALARRMTTVDEIRARVLAATHWPGIAAAARAVSLADGRAESPLETRGRLRLVGGGLAVPELQVEVHDARGFVARVDAWYDAAAVAIEFDGQVKYTDPTGGRSPGQVRWAEKRREDRLREAGVRVVRIVDADLGAEWPQVVARVRRLLSEAKPSPRGFTVVRPGQPRRDTA